MQGCFAGFFPAEKGLIPVRSRRLSRQCHADIYSKGVKLSFFSHEKHIFWYNHTKW